MTNTTQQKIGAYGAQQKSGGDNRETDARALLNCAARLKQAIESGGKDLKEYAEAIRLNQRLWTIFQVSLCDPENKLPQQLKITLLNLSRYVDQVSFRAIGEFKPQLLNNLIDINRKIATGLNKKQKAETVTPATMPTAPLSGTSASVIQSA